MAKSGSIKSNKQIEQHTHNYVYILLCSNNSYYTGYTTNMVRRYQEHVKGTIKSKFTRSFKPLKIAQCWKVYGDKSIAMKVEKYIKSLSRKRKENLIKFPLLLTNFFKNTDNF